MDPQPREDVTAPSRSHSDLQRCAITYRSWGWAGAEQRGYRRKTKGLPKVDTELVLWSPIRGYFLSPNFGTISRNDAIKRSTSLPLASLFAKLADLKKPGLALQQYFRGGGA
jgi:hypothetical protein